MLNVRVGIVPGRLHDVVLTDGASVADALTAAGLEAGSHQIRVDGEVASATSPVREGSRVLLTAQVKGN